ncbi:hypothetical protein PROFUN_02014 [Planoprotostelium fungivorum]|uniref:Uncharacterized protein n=1 Tax=Planoprotostelium fungivorum TaxID=1890364 RepID=A0A2P6NB56_9EUKA|nr:hypothetical protein PROFUN_02014 [Planoprotostelium fungivorum]
MRPIVLAVDPEEKSEDADDESRDRFIQYTESLLDVNGEGDFFIRRSFGTWRRSDMIHVKLYMHRDAWRRLVENPTIRPDIDREIETRILTREEIQRANSALDRDTYGWLDGQHRYTGESPFFSPREIWTSDRDNTPLFLVRWALQVEREVLVGELYRLWSDLMQVARELRPRPKGFSTLLCGRRGETPGRYDIFVALEIDYADYHQSFDLPPRSRYTEQGKRSYHAPRGKR